MLKTWSKFFSSSLHCHHVKLWNHAWRYTMRVSNGQWSDKFCLVLWNRMFPSIVLIHQGTSCSQINGIHLARLVLWRRAVQFTNFAKHADAPINKISNEYLLNTLTWASELVVRLNTFWALQLYVPVSWGEDGSIVSMLVLLVPSVVSSMITLLAVIVNWSSPFLIHTISGVGCPSARQWTVTLLGATTKTSIGFS